LRSQSQPRGAADMPALRCTSPGAANTPTPCLCFHPCRSFLHALQHSWHLLSTFDDSKRGAAITARKWDAAANGERLRCLEMRNRVGQFVIRPQVRPGQLAPRRHALHSQFVQGASVGQTSQHPLPFSPAGSLSAPCRLRAAQPRRGKSSTRIQVVPEPMLRHDS